MMMETNSFVPTNRLLVIATAVAIAVAMTATASEDLAILTFPIGLVVGEHEFEVDLGPSRAPATFMLDGESMCSLGGDIDRCMVDLGPDPRIWLAELIRRDDGGVVTARDHRWINRPGQEAELSFDFSPREPTGICRGRVLWLHPEKRMPVLLLIQHDGRSLRIDDDGRSFAYLCVDPAAPNLLTASAIFADGRRAEAVSLTGGYGGHEGVAMTVAPLVDQRTNTTGCAGFETLLDKKFQAFEETGFEVVFVLDPSAGYRGLLSSAGRRYDVNSSWRRADASLWDADLLWIVMPDKILSRMDAYGSNSEKGYKSTSGKLEWLLNLFTVANAPFKGDVRLADAVAASGLVAASGPRRRAIVLFLGNRADRDKGAFTPGQAQAYLKEIGVPLQVLRIGKVHDDGWPAGEKVLTMRDLANALEALKNRIDGQCMAWFRGDLQLDQIAVQLPEGITIAGRS